MDESKQKLYNERLGRYLAAIKRKPIDRVSTSIPVGSYADAISGYTVQELMYDPQKAEERSVGFLKQYPEIDTFSAGFGSTVNFDIVNSRLYRIPGRDIDPTSIRQFNEDEWMKADEYREFIDDPIGFRMNTYFPRILGEYENRGSTRSYIAFLKAGMEQGTARQLSRQINTRVVNEFAIPPSSQGIINAPFDTLTNLFRGLHGIMRDMFRQPDAIIEACEAILKQNLVSCVGMADPKKQLPVWIGATRAGFLSPKQFEKFYWPTFYDGLRALINAGWTVRVFLEGNWNAHLDHLAEFPKGSVLFDLDNETDIFAAFEKFGDKNVISGGIPTDLLILGTPEEVRQRVKMLIETVGKDGGWIPNSGGSIPAGCKPENFQAMLDAVKEFGVYHTGSAPAPEVSDMLHVKPELPQLDRFITSWEEAKETNKWVIPGDEELIKKNWDMFERMAYSWVISRR